MPTSTTKKQRRPKQAAIIDAAADLFVLHGYDGTSTEMIAEKAGVARQTIYNQYESKQALFLAIATDLVQEIVAPLSEVERSADVRETLLALGRRALTTLLTPRLIALRRLLITEAPRFPELGRAAYETGVLVVESKVASYLKEQGQLRVPDPMLAARQFMALMMHPVEIRTEFGVSPGTDEDIARHIEAAVDTFLRAFGKGAS